MSTLINKPVHVSVVDELGRQLKAASASGMQNKADAITAIMECFGRQDGTLRPQGYSTMTLKSSEAEKLEKYVRRPSLTLVGMSTPSEFMKAIGGGDVASGLLNRFLIVKSEIGVQLSQRNSVASISDRLAKWANEHAHAHDGDLDAGNIHDMPSNLLRCHLPQRLRGCSDSTKSGWWTPSGKRLALDWRPCTIGHAKSLCACP